MMERTVFPAGLYFSQPLSSIIIAAILITIFVAVIFIVVIFIVVILISVSGSLRNRVWNA